MNNYGLGVRPRTIRKKSGESVLTVRKAYTILSKRRNENQLIGRVLFTIRCFLPNLIEKGSPLPALKKEGSHVPARTFFNSRHAFSRAGVKNNFNANPLHDHKFVIMQQTQLH